MLLHHELEKADAIFVFCSNDTRVAEYAAALHHQDLAPLVVVSGDGTQHASALLKDTHQGKKEAEVFKDVLVAKGVPTESIVVEDTVNNTGENFRCTKQLLGQEQMDVGIAIVVQKPYMERRTYATGKVAWPELDFLVTSPAYTFAEYIEGPIDESTIINLMVGDLQRIQEYPKRGFQIEQDIPDEVWEAYEYLVESGYIDHLLT